MASRNPEELAYALVSATTAPVVNKMAVLEAHTLEVRREQGGVATGLFRGLVSQLLRLHRDD